MAEDNILVVAPYNIQVNLLKRTLPKGARVGTVDKFQGQDVEVVIFSMATSMAIRCKTVEQMALVNTLCWAKNYSVKSTLNYSKKLYNFSERC